MIIKFSKIFSIRNIAVLFFASFLFFAFTPKTSAAGCSGTGACYWVGGSGNTNDTTKWATTSGGATTGGLPTSADNCIFNSASSASNYTVNVNATLNCKDMTWANPASGSPTLTGVAGTVFIYGSVFFVSGMNTNAFFTTLNFNSPTPATITTNNVSLYRLYFNNNNNYRVTDDLSFISNVNARLSFYQYSSVDFSTNQTTVTFPIGGMVEWGENNVFYNFTARAAAKTNKLEIKGNLNAANTLTFAGNSSINRLLVSSFTIGTPAYVKAGNVAMSNVDFKDVYAAPYGVSRKIVAIGDSITGNGNYPGDVQTSVRAYSGGEWSVINAGIGGNSTSQMLTRFTTDVTSVSGVEYVAILGGINDIINDASAASVQSNLQSMYNSAKASGLKVIALTITPFKTNAFWTQSRQNVLDAVNAWIMAHPTNVDYVVDTYTAMEDPSVPDTLLPAYAGVDYLHPVTAGYTAIANAVYAGTTWVTASAGVWDLSSVSSGNAGGNNRITFIPAANQYWKHGATASVNWSALTGVDPDYWYTTSGGGTKGRVPLPQDTAIFDQNSFDATGKTVTIDMPRIPTTTFSSVTNSPTLTTNVVASVFGSFTLAPVANWTFTPSTSTYTFEGRDNYQIRTNGNTWYKNLVLNAPGGILSQYDTTTFSGGNAWTVTRGTLKMSDRSISGNVTGLSGTVVLQNNSGDNLTISTDGAFTFTTRVLDSSSYSVAVLTQPTGQVCTVSNGSGTASSDITNVSISCVNTTKAITAFDFNELTPSVVGVVNEIDKTIALTVPYRTVVTALIPTLTFVGASVSPASDVAQDFSTSPVIYTVTADDSSTQDYAVTVAIAPISTRAIATSGNSYRAIQNNLSQSFNIPTSENLKYNFTRDLYLYTTGEDVRELQKFLNKNGFILSLEGLGSVGNETTMFGSVTKNALIKFQQANNITPASGFFGPITRAFIEKTDTLNVVAPVQNNEAPITTITTSATSQFPRDLKFGMSGEDVKMLQQILVSKNTGPEAMALGKHGVTKYFGDLTKQAVIEFQKANNITPAVGYFGEKTKAVIESR